MPEGICIVRNEPSPVHSNGTIRRYLMALGIIAFVTISAWLVMEYPKEMIAVYGGSAVGLAILGWRTR